MVCNYDRPVHVRRSVFDSRAERELFTELDSRLNPLLRLVPQTPLSSLIEFDSATRARLKPRHWDYFLKARVDYTYFYPDGRPLLSIEFDGIGGGFSHGRTYAPGWRTKDPDRVWKLNFKIRAAARAHYPLFVLSADEVEHLDEGVRLMVVDGIVGQIFSRMEERRISEELFAENAARIEQMDPVQAHEYMQDLVLQAGVLADFEFDLLAIETAKERQRCHDRFGFGLGGFTEAWLYDPPLPSASNGTVDEVRRRIEAMRSARRVGGKVGVRVGNGRYIVATAWMRNIGQDHGLTPELVAENVAEYLAIRRTIRLAELGQLDAFAEPSPSQRMRAHGVT